MSVRDALKNIKSTEPEGVGIPVSDGPFWSSGDDLPVTWTDNEIQRLRRRTLRDNWKRGVITKEMYKVMLNG